MEAGPGRTAEMGWSPRREEDHTTPGSRQMSYLVQVCAQGAAWTLLMGNENSSNQQTRPKTHGLFSFRLNTLGVCRCEDMCFPQLTMTQPPVSRGHLSLFPEHCCIVVVKVGSKPDVLNASPGAGRCSSQGKVEAFQRGRSSSWGESETSLPTH